MALETIDTSIAADAALAGDGKPAAEPKAPLSFAAAGDAFLKSLTPDQQAAELADDIGLDDGGDTADEGAGAAAAAESITRPEDGATWKPELSRWVDASGKIVAGAAPEGAPAGKPVAAAPAPTAGLTAPKPAAAPAPKAGEDPAAGSGAVETITLPGLTDRGEEDIELEIDDPAVAERLRRLAKDGLRASAAREQRQALEHERAQFNEVTAAIDDDPVGFMVNRLTPERQLAVARVLLLEHLDALLQEIDELTATPGLRSDKRLEAARAMETSAREAAGIRNARAYAGQIISSIEALVPEDADATDAREFVDSSRAYLATLAQRGERITPETVKTLLTRQLRMFGTPAAAPRPATTVAEPATNAARAVAARAPSIEAATRSAQHVRRVQLARAAATRVAPAGAGAAPVSVPLLKPEDKKDIATASRALQKKGLPDTWASWRSE